MSNGQFAFIVSSSDRRSRRDHELLVSQIKSAAASSSTRPRLQKTFASNPRLRKSTTKHVAVALPEDIVFLPPLTQQNPGAFVASSENEEANTSTSTSASTSPRVKVQYPKQSWVNTPRSLLIATTADPYDSLPYRDVYSPSEAFAFLVDFIVPTLSSINQRFGIYNAYDGWLLGQMAQNNAIFHAIMANMYVARDALSRPSYGTTAQRHRAAAVSQLRHRLLSQKAAADDSAVLTMLFLAILEEILGDQAAFDIHRRHLNAMVKARGGVASLAAIRGVLATSTQLDVWYSPDLATDGLATSFIAYPTPRSLASMKPFLDQLPSGFHDLAMTSVLAIQTLRIIGRMAEVKSPFSVVDGQFRDFRQSCAALSLPDGSDGPSLEKLICQALIRFSINNASHPRITSICFHGITSELTQKVQNAKVPKDRRNVEREALLWVWMMVLDSWSPGAGRLAPRGGQMLVQIQEKWPECATWGLSEWQSFGQRWFWTANLSRILHEYSLPQPQGLKAEESHDAFKPSAELTTPFLMPVSPTRSQPISRSST